MTDTSVLFLTVKHLLVLTLRQACHKAKYSVLYFFLFILTIYLKNVKSTVKLFADDISVFNLSSANTTNGLTNSNNSSVFA